MAQQTIYQVSDWNSTSGQRWVNHQTRLDAMLEVFGKAAIDAASPHRGDVILDIGCGAGATTRDLAQHVGPEGHVLGLDISTPLIERACDLTPKSPSIAFEVGDAARAHLPSAGYDLLFSRFGVMFFDDPTAAFAHLRIALKPQGRLVFICWRGAEENDWVRLPMGAVRPLLAPPSSPASKAPGPFSFGASDHVMAILGAAGFTDIAFTKVDHAIPFGLGATREEALDDAVRMAFEVGPLSRALIGQPSAILDRAAIAVREAFSAKPGDNSVMIDGAAWIVSARRV